MGMDWVYSGPNAHSGGFSLVGQLESEIIFECT